MPKVAQQIEILRSAFGKVKSMDPSGHVYSKLCAILDAADDEALKAAAQARIPFVSPLALNRMVRRGLTSQ